MTIDEAAGATGPSRVPAVRGQRRGAREEGRATANCSRTGSVADGRTKADRDTDASCGVSLQGEARIVHFSINKYTQASNWRGPRTIRDRIPRSRANGMCGVALTFVNHCACVYSILQYCSPAPNRCTIKTPYSEKWKSEKLAAGAAEGL